MTLYSEDFSGGTNGASITTTDSSFSFLSGTRTYANTPLYTPSGLGLVGVFIASSYGRLDKSFTTQCGFSIYFRRTAAQDGTREIIQLRDSSGATTIGGVAIDASNQIVALNGATAITGSEMATSVDTWYRLDTLFTIHASTGRVQGRLVDVSAADSNTPVDSYDIGSLNLGSTAVGRAYFGFPVDAGADGNMIIQHIRAEDGITAFHDGLWVPTTSPWNLADGAGGSTPMKLYVVS